MSVTGFALGLGCECCDADCSYSLCVRPIQRCAEMWRATIGSGPIQYVASTVAFDGPNGEHVEVTTGGGGLQVAKACIPDPAPGLWTITITPEAPTPDFKPKTVTVTVVECESQTIYPQLCPSKIILSVVLGGCVPAEACGPITIDITGPGVITPSSFDWWDVGPIPTLAPVEVDLTDIDLDDDCDAALEWEATATPPAGTGIAPVTDVSGATGGTLCYGAQITLTLVPPPGTVCACLSPKPETLEFSDDWGACTLTHGAESNIYPWWEPWNGISPLSATHPWIGSYSFECDDACGEPAPCEPYGPTGVSLERRTVTVVIAAGCDEIIKIVAIGTASCESIYTRCLRSTHPMSGQTEFGACYFRATLDNDDCSSSVMASGAWTMPPSQSNGCQDGVPCAGGNWTLTG